MRLEPTLLERPLADEIPTPSVVTELADRFGPSATEARLLRWLHGGRGRAARLWALSVSTARSAPDASLGTVLQGAERLEGDAEIALAEATRRKTRRRRR